MTLLDQARQAGIALRLDSIGRLVVELPDPEPPDADALLAAIREQAEEVKRAIREQAAPRPPAGTGQPARARRPIDPGLAAKVEAALRRGQWVRIETDFGDIILAPNRWAAERAAKRHPNTPIFQPGEWREILACETPDELAVLIELKRTLGATLLPSRTARERSAKP